MRCVKNNLRERQRKAKKPPAAFTEMSGRHLRISTRLVLREAQRQKCKLTGEAEQYLKKIDEGWASEDEEVVYSDMGQSNAPAAPAVDVPPAVEDEPAAPVDVPPAVVDAPPAAVVDEEVREWAKTVRKLRRIMNLRKGEPLPESAKKRAKLPLDVEDRI